MKKVFLIRNASGFGGGEIYQIKLATELQKAGFLPVILTNSNQLLLEAKQNKIEAIKSPYVTRQNWSGPYNLLLPIYFLRLRKLQKWYENIFKKEKPSVVNIQSRDEFIVATRAAKKLGIKILWTDHADFKNWVLTNVNMRFKNVIGKTIINLSSEVDKVIFVSKVVYQQTKKMIRPLKIKNAIVIQNGVVDECQDYKNIKADKASFVFIGRVVKDKGINELLEAFTIVRRRFSSAKLNIYGLDDSGFFSNIPNDGVEFHGTTKDPLRVLAQNEIFVLPSYKEGLSLSLLEAAMMQKIIVASNVDGNLEVVKNGKTGFLAPAKDSQKLADAMTAALTSKYAKTLAKNARKRYEQEFNFEKIFQEKMLPLYKTEDSPVLTVRKKEKI